MLFNSRPICTLAPELATIQSGLPGGLSSATSIDNPNMDISRLVRLHGPGYDCLEQNDRFFGHYAIRRWAPGLPEPMSDQVPSNEHRHSLPIGYQVVKRSVLAAYIMNMGSRRRLLSDGPFFAGIPNQPANCSVFCARPSFWTIRAHGSDIEALP